MPFSAHGVSRTSGVKQRRGSDGMNHAELDRALREWEDRKGGGQAARDWRKQPASAMPVDDLRDCGPVVKSRRYHE